MRNPFLKQFCLRRTMTSKPGDPRLCELLKSDDVKKGPKVALLGFPCCIGSEINALPSGSKDGPKAVRKVLYSLGPIINPEFGIDVSQINFADKGDIKVTDSLEENHATLEKDVTRLLDEGYVGILLGGSHDQSYPNARALMNNCKTGDIAVVNVDAHLDVRPFVNGRSHSGSPFRKLFEDKEFKGMLHEFACQGSQCSQEHTDYVKQHGGRFTWLSEIRESTAKVEFQKVLTSFGNRDVFVSVDLDFIQGSDCPGVVYPGVVGLSSQEALDIFYMAGKHSKTRLLEINEFDPHCEERRTARLIANIIYYFLMGVASRETTRLAGIL